MKRAPRGIWLVVKGTTSLFGALLYAEGRDLLKRAYAGLRNLLKRAWRKVAR